MKKSTVIMSVCASAVLGLVYLAIGFTYLTRNNTHSQLPVTSQATVSRNVREKTVLRVGVVEFKFPISAKAKASVKLPAAKNATDKES